MKPISISEIKKDLEKRHYQELMEYCLRFARFKKENKELLAFLLFHSDNIAGYIENVKQQIDSQFEEMNKSNIYFIKKSVRKILRTINKHIRFSSSKQTEAELLIHFCNSLHKYAIPIKRSQQLTNLFHSQIKKIEAAISTLHPDLQYDLKKQLEQ